MLTDLDLRRMVCGQDFMEFRDLGSDVRMHGLAGFRGVAKVEESVKIVIAARIDVIPIEHQHASLVDGQPGAFQHPVLDR